ncbi:polycomb protein Scm-like isoform X3 [Myxocyprinus asiaticus]|uniref:polycomb protein Scm-like isoform X3 n=1 Tax=Myxocyprinus asiaticus TaxID=70543 RepID=UPI0022226A74|nr:polycomb protein Scm-like isoform X3 [Myxocyprinus asiaticus]
MSEPKYRQWILETIDSLRSRKARPDLERICRMVRRRHGSDPDQTRAELEKLIEEQTVLKVSYKGSISYRNAAKVQRKCRKRMEQNSGSGESVREPTKHANGDSAHSFTDHGECEDRHPEDRGEEVKEEERIETEGEEDGTKKNAVSTAEDVPKTITDEGPTGVEACTDPISTDMEVEADNGNSFLMTSEGKPQITSPLESSNQCAVQQEVDVGGSEEQTVSVESEDAGFENSAVTPDQLHPSTEDNVIVTSDTVKAPLSIPIRNFVCVVFSSGSGCKMEVSSCLLTPSASPGAAEERGMNEGIGGFVKLESNGLNPADWTVADVASYFTTAGFPEQAHAFRTQEIDGKSLLLMQRNDVLTGLSIRLGPALKIYERHVKMLQRTHFQDDESFC